MCGEGLGHTSRCISLASAAVRAGHDVHLGAYGYSKELCEKSGYTVHEIPSEIKLVGKSGSLDMLESIEATVKNMQILGGPKVLKLVGKLKPDVVVSDSYYLGVMAAKAKKIPTYLIVNQTNMLEFFRDRGVGLRLLGEMAKGFYTAVFENVDKIVIPDFPPPYTVCSKNLVFTETMSSKVFFTGPLVRKYPTDVKAKKHKGPHVLSMVGGFGYRKGLFDSVLKVASSTKKISYTLVSGPNVDRDVLASAGTNVKIYDFIADPFPHLKGADIVIAPGGHSTMMEAMAFGVPLLSFPDMFHSEQENNADQLEALGVGKRLGYHTPHEVLEVCIDELLSDRSYSKKAKRLSKLSTSLSGSDRLLDLICQENGL